MKTFLTQAQIERLYDVAKDWLSDYDFGLFEEILEDSGYELSKACELAKKKKYEEVFILLFTFNLKH